MFGHSAQIETLGGTYYIYKWPNIPTYLGMEHEVYPAYVLPNCRNNSINMMKLRSVLDSTYQNKLSRMSDDQVIKAVNNMINSGKAVLVKKRNLSFIQSLRFDGNKLCWINHCGAETRCWPAVSGRTGYQTKEHQSKADYGPLPEGRWIVKQSESADIHERYYSRNVKCSRIKEWQMAGKCYGVGRSSRLASSSCRNEYFWQERFFYTRRVAAGSAGCIDMTSSISEFISYFMEYGKDMELIVAYI